MPKGKFARRVGRKLAQRACYLCSNCKTPTAGPHTDPHEATITGEAGHIRAANPGGARYDAKQTDEERHSPSNAIWLCRNCHKKLDTDWKDWPAEKLLEMKQAHENWLAQKGIVPKLPDITITTKAGLSALPGMVLTGGDCRHYREHSLTIRNSNKVELYNVQAELHLPERAAAARVKAPPGLSCCFRPKGAGLHTTIKGGGSVSVPRQQPSSLWELAIDRIPAEARIDICFLTIPPRPREDGPSPALWGSLLSNPDVIAYFVAGTYQFALWNEYITRTFVVPLLPDAEKRTIASEPIRESPKPKRIVEVSGLNI